MASPLWITTTATLLGRGPAGSVASYTRNPTSTTGLLAPAGLDTSLVPIPAKPYGDCRMGKPDYYRIAWRQHERLLGRVLRQWERERRGTKASRRMANPEASLHPVPDPLRQLPPRHRADLRPSGSVLPPLRVLAVQPQEDGSRDPADGAGNRVGLSRAS